MAQTAISLEAADGGIAQRALSTAPMMYLGKVSYGTYLWHWIVILVILKRFHISTTATIGITCLVATALAALSFEILEHPANEFVRELVGVDPQTRKLVLERPLVER